MSAFVTFLAAYALSQFYRAFLAVIAPELARELTLDPQALGNMQAVWIAGFTVMQFPVGWALDTIGPRRTVASLMLLAILGAGLFARATSPLELDVAMALIGMGCSAIYMGALYVFARVFPRDRFALVGSALLGLGSAGNLIAASPMGWAAAHIGWRAAMLLIAGATAASALCVALFVRDPPPIAHATRHGFFGGVAAILSIRALWPLLPLTAVSYAVLLAERGLWAGPYFSQVFGLDAARRGDAILAMAVAMSLGALAYGPLDRYVTSRKAIVGTGCAITAACFLALALGDPPLGPAVAAMAGVGFFGISYGVLMAHARGFFEDHLVGRGMTTMNVLFIGGAGVLQPISGAAMTAMRGAPPALAFARLHLGFALALIVALVVYAFAQERPKPP